MSVMYEERSCQPSSQMSLTDRRWTKLDNKHVPESWGSNIETLLAKFRVTTLQTMWNSMLSVTHIMPVLALVSVVGIGMQQCIKWNTQVQQSQEWMQICS